MPRKPAKRTRAKRRSASKDELSIPFRLVGETFGHDRIPCDHGSTVRTALIESIHTHIDYLSSTDLVGVLGVLSQWTGKKRANNYIPEPPTDLA